MTYFDGASVGIWLHSINYFDFEVEIINQGHRNINLEYLRWDWYWRWKFLKFYFVAKFYL